MKQRDKLSQLRETMNSPLLMLSIVLLAECKERIITNYFQSKNVHVLNIYLCNKEEAKELTKNLIKNKNFMVNIAIPNGKKTNFGESLYVTQGYYMNLNCEKNMKNLFELCDVNAFNDSFVWLMSADSPEILQALQALPLGINSDVVLRLGNGSLYDIYKTAPRFRFQVYDCGVLNKTDFRLEKAKRTSLDGVTLIGGIVIVDLKLDGDFKNISRLLTDPSYYPEFDVFARPYIIFHQFLQMWLNYKLKHIKSSTWGYRDTQTGKMTGLVGDLGKGKADIGLTPVQPREERWSEANFLPALWFISVFRQPKVLGTTKALALPFSNEVWISTFITLVLFTIVYEIIVFAGRSFSKRNRLENGEGFLYIIGIMAQQGLMHNPSTCSVRILSVFVLFLGLLVITYYNAAVLNSLLTPAPNSIQTMKQLVRTKYMGVGVINISHVTHKVNWQLYFDAETQAKIEHTKNYIMSLADGLDRVKTERFALYGDDIPLYSGISRLYTDSEICELAEVDGVPAFPMSLPVPRNTSVKEIFTQAILWLRENGLSERTRKIWHPSSPPCYGSIAFMHVKLEAIVIALGIYLGGIILSLLILATEKLIHLRQKTIVEIIRKIN
ncbi:glutamate receptor ionotropic, delta-2-like isoform X2 [Cimex lectularius]|uniref:Ionotropic receptor n=1 Tax=Cimex lectularius TaxID=79782 RepID=A0A8I6SQX0_CIMLE|nr:glutamate receptor ionotropic, delta-2-like isoform X2 [Cimex lectularius]